MDTTPTTEQRAEARGIKLNRSRGKSYATITLDGQDNTFDGPTPEDVLADALAYADIHDSGGVFSVDYNEADGKHIVKIAGSGETFSDISPAIAYEQALAAHEAYLEEEKKAEAARAKQEKPKPATRSRKKNGDAVDDKGNLRPTEAERVTPLAEELDEKGWEKNPHFVAEGAGAAMLPSDLLILGFDTLINGLVQIRDGIKAFNKGD